jgi:uncharacterized membrane protein YidH (DUF202 family)
MISVSLVLLPLLAFAAWLFVRAKPNTDRQVAMQRFNVWALIAVTISIAAVSLYMWGDMIGSVDRGAWPLLAAIGSVVVAIAELIVFAIIRFIIFRRKPHEIAA